MRLRYWGELPPAKTTSEDIHELQKRLAVAGSRHPRRTDDLYELLVYATAVIDRIDKSLRRLDPERDAAKPQD